MIFYVQPRKAFAREIAEAWRAGAPFTEISESLVHTVHRVGVFYGVTPETKEIFSKVSNYIYIDNGYFSPGHKPGGYFRVTKNALQHSGLGAVKDHSRIEAHKLEFRDFRPLSSPTDPIILAVQSDWWYVRHGFAGGLKQWVEETTARLRRYTSRPIRVRLKPKAALYQPPNVVSFGKVEFAENQVPLSKDLEGAHALVTHSSNAAIEAIVAGVPVFCLGPSAALAMGRNDLSLIEFPFRPSKDQRLHWAKVLSCNQWTMNEMRSGSCFREIINQ